VDRRKFFTQSADRASGKILDLVNQAGKLTKSGGLLSSIRPNGLIGALFQVADTLVKNTPVATPSREVLRTQLTRTRPFIRTGEPIDVQGTAFGGPIAALAILETPSVVPGSRICLIAAHPVEGPLGGITVIELVHKPEKGWKHIVSGIWNKRLNEKTPIHFDGRRIFEEGRTEVYPSAPVPVGATNCLKTTPWGTVLCGERNVIELTPTHGLAARRPMLGDVSPTAMELVVSTGRPVTVYLAGQSPKLGLFKFVSHQKYVPHVTNATNSVLAIGELFAAREGKWEPADQGSSHAEFGIVQALEWDGAALKISGAGGKWLLRENGLPDAARGYEIRSAANGERLAAPVSVSGSVSESVPGSATVSVPVSVMEALTPRGDALFTVQPVDGGAAIFVSTQ
jgi:hypothetical protein